MALYGIEYGKISEEENAVWEEIKKREIISELKGGAVIKKSLYRQYPKAVRHFLSLFPNNFVDSVDLKEKQLDLEVLLSDFKLLLDNKSTSERNVLNYIRDNQAWFIVGSILKNKYHFGHHALYLFPELPFPPNYQVDYLLIGENSEGYHFVFVEFENPYGDITLKDGSYGTTIRKGISQIFDWEVWLEKNYSHLKLIFESKQNSTKILPNEFRDFDRTRIHYVVVAGRRQDFNEKTYRLRRKDFEEKKLLVLHYDNLIDMANEVIGTFTY